MHRHLIGKCKTHGEGAALRKSGLRCKRCNWDGYAVFSSRNVQGYNGRSRAARARDIKPHQHGTTVRQTQDDRKDYDVMGGSRRMAQSAERVALRRMAARESRDILSAIGY